MSPTAEAPTPVSTSKADASSPTTNVELRPATAEDLPAMSDLHVAVFGPGRFARTAYRVREGAPSLSPYCQVAHRDGALIATVSFTQINIGDTGGALLLGPLAVVETERGRTNGEALIRAGVNSARGGGIALVLLVGDLAYYGRHGFVQVPPGQITMPGPVDYNRLLAFEIERGALARFKGPIAADR